MHKLKKTRGSKIEKELNFAIFFLSAITTPCQEKLELLEPCVKPESKNCGLGSATLRSRSI